MKKSEECSACRALRNVLGDAAHKCAGEHCYWEIVDEQEAVSPVNRRQEDTMNNDDNHDVEDEENWADHVESMVDRDFYGGNSGVEFADPGGTSALHAASASMETTKIYLVQDCRSDDGPLVYRSRQGAASALQDLLPSDRSGLTACRNIAGHAEEERVEAVVKAFITSETDEMCVMDDDQFTTCWIKEEEVRP